MYKRSGIAKTVGLSGLGLALGAAPVAYGVKKLQDKERGGLGRLRALNRNVETRGNIMDKGFHTRRGARVGARVGYKSGFRSGEISAARRAIQAQASSARKAGQTKTAGALKTLGISAATGAAGAGLYGYGAHRSRTRQAQRGTAELKSRLQGDYWRSKRSGKRALVSMAARRNPEKYDKFVQERMKPIGKVRSR